MIKLIAKFCFVVFFIGTLKSAQVNHQRYETFCAVQKLRALAVILAQVACENQEDAITYCRQEPEYQEYQTRYGLYFTSEHYPKNLYTPWGKIALFTHAACSSNTCDELFKAFGDNVHLHFVKNYAEKRNPPTDFYIRSQDRVITERELNKYRATDIIIQSCGGHESVYKIKAVAGKKLPHARMKPERKYTDTQAEWALLQEQYAHDVDAKGETRRFKKELREKLFTKLPTELPFFSEESTDLISWDTFRKIGRDAYHLAAVLTDNPNKAHHYYYAKNLAQWFMKRGDINDPLRNKIVSITLYAWNPETQRFKWVKSYDTDTLENFAQEIDDFPLMSKKRKREE